MYSARWLYGSSRRAAQHVPSWDQDTRMVGLGSLVASGGGQAIAIVILASIVIPAVALGWLCWFFWKHRHDQ